MNKIFLPNCPVDCNLPGLRDENRKDLRKARKEAAEVERRSLAASRVAERAQKNVNRTEGHFFLRNPKLVYSYVGLRPLKLAVQTLDEHLASNPPDRRTMRDWKRTKRKLLYWDALRSRSSAEGWATCLYAQVRYQRACGKDTPYSRRFEDWIKPVVVRRSAPKARRRTHVRERITVRHVIPRARRRDPARARPVGSRAPPSGDGSDSDCSDPPLEARPAPCRVGFPRREVLPLPGRSLHLLRFPSRAPSLIHLFRAKPCLQANPPTPQASFRPPLVPLPSGPLGRVGRWAVGICFRMPGSRLGPGSTCGRPRRGPQARGRVEWIDHE
jgi:hypothetical protein